MKKVGKLNGKVVVAGDKNLVTANQIHYEEKDGNITLSERRGGELNSVTGSGSSGEGSEFLYYKVVYSDKVLDIYGQSISVLDIFANVVSTTIGMWDLIMFKSSDYDGASVGSVAHISGSQEYAEDHIMVLFRTLFLNKKIHGFVIYKNSRAVIDFYENTKITTAVGNLFDKIKISMNIPNPVPPEAEMELKVYETVINECAVLISKEEYEALS